MFKSKYKRKYEQIVSYIEAEIWLNNGIIKIYEEDIKKLEERGSYTTALRVDMTSRKECVAILEQILKRAKEAWFKVSFFFFFYLAKFTCCIMRKIEDVKDEEQKGLLRTERANLPGRGGSEYKLIFGIHVDVGR